MPTPSSVTDALSTPVGAKRMALSPAEQALVLAHRARTEKDAEWNKALDLASSMIREASPEINGSWTSDQVRVLCDNLVHGVAAAKRDV